MEAVPPDALRLVTPRDWERPRDGGQVAVECSVEARHLRHTGAALCERRDQVEFGRQVRGVESLQSLKIAEQFRRDDRRGGVVGSAVHEAVHRLTVENPQKILDDAGAEQIWP